VAVSLLVVSDTHIPGRARDLPTEVWSLVEAADLVIHAGDWVGEPLLDAVTARSKALLAVYGNNDAPALRSGLPEVARQVVDGVRIGVVHETGQAAGRERRCENAYPDLDVLVFGHSHIPWDSTTPRGLRLLNPGSPTDRRRQPHATFLTAIADAGRLRDVTLHALLTST
jgi:putative phosphoesterase